MNDEHNGQHSVDLTGDRSLAKEVLDQFEKEA